MFHRTLIRRYHPTEVREPEADGARGRNSDQPAAWELYMYPTSSLAAACLKNMRDTHT